MNKHKVVTIVGSTRFKDEILSEAERLTLEESCLVLTSHVFSNSVDSHIDVTESQKANLKEICYHMIDMSDEVFCLNKGGYIGHDTLEDLAYATASGKKISYYEPLSCSYLFTYLKIPYPFDGDLENIRRIPSLKGHIANTQDLFWIHKSSINRPEHMTKVMVDEGVGLQSIAVCICNIEVGTYSMEGDT